MKKQQLSYFGGLLTLLLFIALPCRAETPSVTTAPAANTIQTNQLMDETQYLMIQHGNKATIAHNPGSKTFTITLRDASPYVAYFSDRPTRKAGTIPLQEFLQLWTRKGTRSFQNDPPNANFNAMEMGTSHSEGIKNFSIELTNPQYDSQTNTLRYTATPLPGTEIPKASVLHYITLFIDDVCLKCW